MYGGLRHTSADDDIGGMFKMVPYSAPTATELASFLNELPHVLAEA